jgi:hypothetical protein
MTTAEAAVLPGTKASGTARRGLRTLPIHISHLALG